MSNRDNFAGGFLAGAVFGGIVGGIFGALLASARSQDALPDAEPAEKSKKRAFKPADEKSIEAARQGLEDKIAQLNDAIDDVRQQLSSVNHDASDFDDERFAAEEMPRWEGQGSNRDR